LLALSIRVLIALSFFFLKGVSIANVRRLGSHPCPYDMGLTCLPDPSNVALASFPDPTNVGLTCVSLTFLNMVEAHHVCGLGSQPSPHDMSLACLPDPRNVGLTNLSGPINVDLACLPGQATWIWHAC